MNVNLDDDDKWEIVIASLTFIIIGIFGVCASLYYISKGIYLIRPLLATAYVSVFSMIFGWVLDFGLMVYLRLDSHRNGLK